MNERMQRERKGKKKRNFSFFLSFFLSHLLFRGRIGTLHTTRDVVSPLNDEW
jgi:hypothetical protein